MQSGCSQSGPSKSPSSCLKSPFPFIFDWHFSTLVLREKEETVVSKQCNTRQARQSDNNSSNSIYSFNLNFSLFCLLSICLFPSLYISDLSQLIAIQQQRRFPIINTNEIKQLNQQQQQQQQMMNNNPLGYYGNSTNYLQVAPPGVAQTGQNSVIITSPSQEKSSNFNSN